MEKGKASDLAEKKAKLIVSESGSSDLSSIQASLDQIIHRLDQLESRPENSLPVIRPLQSNHPSMDRFAIAEAIVDSLFERETKEKACTFEPNGKPCDHCSMCSSRGF